MRDRIRTVSEFLRFAVSRPLLLEPGSGHLYSNAGYVLLGAVIEHVTGLSYDDYVREHITRPAGMETTGFFEKDAPVPGLARGYLPEGAPTGLRLLPPPAEPKSARFVGPPGDPPGGPGAGAPQQGLRDAPPEGPSGTPPQGPAHGPRSPAPPTGEPQLISPRGPVPESRWQDNYDALPAKGNPSGGDSRDKVLAHRFQLLFPLKVFGELLVRLPKLGERAVEPVREN